MNTIKYLFAIGVVTAVMCGCKGSKEMGAKEPGKYERKPLVEVSEAQLAVETAMIDAKMQQELNNTSEALSRYRAILQKSPNYAPAHYEVSQIMAGMNRLDSAIFHCEKAIEADGRNKWYRLSLADLYGRRGRTEKQIAVWEELVRQNPDEIDYYYELSNTYIIENNIPKAVEVLNRVEKRLGVTEAISLQKNKLWNAVGKYDKGAKELEALVNEFPEEMKYCSMLAQAMMSLKQYEKAKKYFDRILSVNPNDGYTHLSVAQYYQIMGKDEDAFRSLKKGFAYSDLTTQGKLQFLSQFYPNEDFYGRYSKFAFPLMDEIMAQSDDSLSFALFYGDVLMRQGKFAEAAYQFEKYLVVDSSKHDLWEVILICESSIDDNDARILNFAKRACALFPLQSLPYYLQGSVALRKNDYMQAVELLERCVDLGFMNAHPKMDCYGLLAWCYYKMEQPEKAFANYDKHLRVRPDDYGTMNNYAYYLAQCGQQLEKAEAMAKTACTAEPTNATFLDTYAWVLYKSGKKGEAIEIMKKALQYATGDDSTFQNHWKTINEE